MKFSDQFSAQFSPMILVCMWTGQSSHCLLNSLLKVENVTSFRHDNVSTTGLQLGACGQADELNVVAGSV